MNASRLTLLAACVATLGACSNGSYDRPKPPANMPPVLTAIADRAIDQDTTLMIEFALMDPQTDAAQIMVSAAADGMSPFPADGITLGGNGGTRTLTLTPLEAATGTAVITVTATDPQGLSTMRSFTVNVQARVASLLETTLATLAKDRTDDPTVLNGLTFTQDVNDPSVFDPFLGTP